MNLLEKILSLVFNPNQAASFNYLKKSNLNKENEYEIFKSQLEVDREKEYEKVKAYFIEKQQDQNLDEIDMKLLKSIFD